MESNKITKQYIESLGFNFICKDDDNDSDYSFSKTSKKNGWVDLLVWQPRENNITISTHVEDIRDYFGEDRTKYIDKISKIIKQKFNGEILETDVLKKLCKDLKVLHND
jgi:hypothetical protein